MSTVVEEAELCQCVMTASGSLLDNVWLCRECHKYWKGKKRLTSVSRVIGTLMPFDASAIPIGILETARLRGIAIDGWFSEYLTNDTVTAVAIEGMSEYERQDAEDRFGRLVEFWERSGLHATRVQEIVYSEQDGIAGTYDIATEDMIIDLKCVHELNPNYALQLGAYLTYDPQKFPLRDAAILHVSKKKVELVKYDAMKCKRQWRACVDWFHTRRELTEVRPRKRKAEIQSNPATDYPSDSDQ